MHNIVIVNNDEDFDLKSLSSTGFEINHVKSVKAAIIYQIEFPEIDAIIYDSNSIDHRDIVNNLEKSQLLNPMVLQFVVGNIELTTRLENNSKIVVIDNIPDIFSHIKSNSINRRQDNRATWPIRVSYHNSDEPNLIKSGMILSISVGGCFIKTDYLELGKKGDLFVLNVNFEDFNFLVEGEVVRVQRIANMSSPQGFSIKFHTPTPQTKGYIEEIINNKILSTIFSDFNHLEGSTI